MLTRHHITEQNTQIVKNVCWLCGRDKLIVLCFRQKWFRGRKIHTDWDIRVEQCQFSDLAITANTEEGINVGLVSVKNGQRNIKWERVILIIFILIIWISICFSLLKPDFLLIRQDPRDAGEDFKSALLGFQYGQVPSINSLESVYNFQVKLCDGVNTVCPKKLTDSPSLSVFLLGHTLQKEVLILERLLEGLRTQCFLIGHPVAV